jgi:glycosyltransferase involved in cell wall biosynthesis
VGLHVLAYGELDSGVTDSLRLGIFREPLAGLGVQLRPWSSFDSDVLMGGEGGLTGLEWADVVLFRRWRPTHSVCTECERPFDALAGLESHLRSSGHRTMVPDLRLRPLVELLEAHPELIASRGIVYDTDDDVLAYPEWTGFARAAGRERDLVLRILGLADVVTVATPVLAARLAPHTRGSVRVVRNALDPAWYRYGLAAGGASGAKPDGGVSGAMPAGAAGGPRIVYHGVPVRLRDYEIARGAVDAVAAETSGLRRVWLGAAEERRVAAAVDEVLPWVDGLDRFAAALVGARPDVGLAPLRDEPFNRAKSELHWLEYSLAGAATIVSGFEGGGPFDAIRDGVDGLIAHGPDDWLRHLRALAGSADLRAELAGRARERVLAEYTLAARAPEWADAFRWAAQHAAIGRRPGGVSGLSGSSGGAARGETSGGVAAGVEGGEAAFRVLVLGPGAASVSDALRYEAMAVPLAARGMAISSWTPGDVPDPAMEPAMLEVALARADVVVFRRSYRTFHSCLGCGARSLDRAEIRAHARASGHDVVESPFALVRPLVQLLESEPRVLGHRAIVYDTDDDFLSAELPAGAEDLVERDLVERILGLADLVTTATPLLAERLAGRTTAPIRVVRNALDPAWYESARDSGAKRPESEVRVVHHGGTSRLAEYEVARSAVDAVARDMPALRRVWLGSTDPKVVAAVDEARPWVRGLPGFGAALAEVWPDIGLAPLRDTPFNRCRSELHWLEYSLAGAATIASDLGSPGPYDPIRDGVDGFVARDPADWQRHLRALGESRDLRAEIAGRARERVVAGYSLIKRADEWADAYRWALEHARHRR